MADELCQYGLEMADFSVEAAHPVNHKVFTRFSCGTHLVTCFKEVPSETRWLVFPLRPEPSASRIYHHLGLQRGLG